MKGISFTRGAPEFMLLGRGPFVRRLGSWARRFESARGAALAERLALATELTSKKAWKLDTDEAEARAMESEARAPSGSQFTFVLSVENTAVAIMRAALMPTGQNTGAKHYGLLIGSQCDPALSLTSVGEPLIRAATAQLKQRGAERVLAIAPLPGLCEWVVKTEGWKTLDRSAPGFTADQIGAVESVARGTPRESHVLGVGTFKAARPGFERLALAYAHEILSDADSEAAMFATHGAKVVGINCALAPGLSLIP